MHSNLITQEPAPNTAGRMENAMKALEGIRVLDLSRFQSGPVCGMLLGDMGAEVIRVEELKGAPDRSWGLLGPDGETLSYKIVGRGRKGITLSMSDPEGKKLFRDLVRHADVVFHNFSPGAPQVKDLEYDVLKQLNQRIIVAAISGFGQEGPDAQLVCFDHVAQARSGGMILTGFPGDPPLKTTITYNDITSGLLALTGILLALYHRQKSGVGQFVDVSLFDAAFFSTQLMGALLLHHVYGEVRRQVGNLGFHSYIGIFETSDGNWVLISGTTNAIWKRLTRAIGHEEMAEDPRFQKNDMVRYSNAKLIDEVIGAWVHERSSSEVLSTLREQRVPCGIVNTIDKLIDDPQVKARNMVRYVDYPELGKLPVPGVPLNLSATPGDIGARSPALGEHNEEIYCGLLGLTKRKLKELKNKGIV
jgi:crotonobetainyl-CoA:carnitine CoA-transferase CaiB-like acyl-CoA transferase